jgi:hypothetical protein
VQRRRSVGVGRAQIGALGDERAHGSGVLAFGRVDEAGIAALRRAGEAGQATQRDQEPVTGMSRHGVLPLVRLYTTEPCQASVPVCNIVSQAWPDFSQQTGTGLIFRVHRM